VKRALLILKDRIARLVRALSLALSLSSSLALAIGSGTIEAAYCTQNVVATGYTGSAASVKAVGQCFTPVGWVYVQIVSTATNTVVASTTLSVAPL
jgi:hypothetical protein